MIESEKISKYLTVGDAIKSETAIRKGIDNSLPAALLSNAKYIATKVYDPIKDRFPDAGCYSFFRCDKLNVAVGGSRGSFHSYAGAIDTDTPGNVHNREIFKWVIDENVPFNQVIWEYGTLEVPEWVHVGLLPGDTRHHIKRIWIDAQGIVRNDLLTKEQAIKLFKL
jgi:hypothetical protein